MAVDFAIICSLVRPGRPRYPVLVHRAAALLHASFRPHLAMTPLRFANPSPPSGWIEDLHLQAVDHARHTNKSPALVRSGASICGGFASAAHCRPPHLDKRHWRLGAASYPDLGLANYLMIGDLWAIVASIKQLRHDDRVVGQAVSREQRGDDGSECVNRGHAEQGGECRILDDAAQHAGIYRPRA